MSAPTRSAKILYLIAEHPGLNNAEIFAAISRSEPDVSRKTVNATVHYLLRAGKAWSTGTRHDRRSFLESDGLVDRRTKKRATRPPQTAKRRPVALPAPETVPAATAAPPKTAQKTAQKPTRPVRQTATGPLDSADIARDIARFKRQGGRIEKLPMGASATPLTGVGVGHAAVNEYTWRKAMHADIPN